MTLLLESSHWQDYLKENEIINFSHPLIRSKASELFKDKQSDMEKVKTAYHYVRDRIAHSWDIQSKRVTLTAAEVLFEGEGICYAKSHLLAALLRSEGIPAGFCYQRLMLFDTPDKGYCLHGLNGVFIESVDQWIRLDARGNKPGVQAEFSLDEEKLAFPVNESLGEADYPVIYAQPNRNIVALLKKHSNGLEMYENHLPDEL
ncbi:transglutaminase-like domain-containing protein [Paenibacillus senegalensis]|uniref:transglutaminase-like domain-containing protein n=1 Tax=Paenibacillus senegalensis TaxID=1465766 RepID=UPI000288B6FA|nr:transglutaminase family protein [Paenibacillus senegalensis]